ncbi:hypothetical protein GOBAR_AA17057 [Gossypium barbadense]|uniref:Uncharacterized protein n=1 Tax=Gossypium barbadense TaxID=3634 RepID=A0A2P5XJT6_GOSBA|nr:hypothetical protein GOBAR_AA17057 [Gossypium barbadense]
MDVKKSMLTIPSLLSLLFLPSAISIDSCLASGSKVMCKKMVEAAIFEGKQVSESEKHTTVTYTYLWIWHDIYIYVLNATRRTACIRLDLESERVVTKKEGINFAREYGCLFIECSAKTRVNVQQCFDELVLKILDTPSLLAEGSKGGKKNIFKQKPPQLDASASGCC